jgi:hypothetical protein
MSFKIEITGDLAGVITLPKQLQFAIAKSLTDVAVRSQKLIPGELNQDFIVRGDWWRKDRKHGIKIKAATKSSFESQVYTSADWLLEAEGYHGGVKEPDGDGTNLAIPETEHTRHGIRNVVQRGEKARKLLANAKRTKAFKVTAKNGKTLIMQRVGLDSEGLPLRSKRGNYLRGRGKKVKSKVVLKYVLRPRVKVPYHPVITRTTIYATRSHFGSYLSENTRKALQSARLK